MRSSSRTRGPPEAHHSLPPAPCRGQTGAASFHAPGAAQRMVSAAVWGARAARLAKLVALGLLLGLFIGALFAIPSPYTAKLRGHATYMRMVATDDETRAGAVEYVNVKMALLPAVMSDIRCAAPRRAAQARAHASARRTKLIIPMLHVCVGITAFLSAMVAAGKASSTESSYRIMEPELCAPDRPAVPLLRRRLLALHLKGEARGQVLARAIARHGTRRGTERPPPQRATLTALRAPQATFPHLYPRVVVQLPMFNELEVCRQVIEAACELEWPRERLMVQILDDSTDEIARERIQDAVNSWREQGLNVTYRWRSNRQGYKAGAMAEAMEDIAEYDHIGRCPPPLASRPPLTCGRRSNLRRRLSSEHGLFAAHRAVLARQPGGGLRAGALDVRQRRCARLTPLYCLVCHLHRLAKARACSRGCRRSR